MAMKNVINLDVNFIEKAIAIVLKWLGNVQVKHIVLTI